MAAEAICDGCGKRAPMANCWGSWHKPRDWFERTPKGEGSITACSRECIEAVESKLKDEGKETNPCILPI